MNETSLTVLTEFYRVLPSFTEFYRVFFRFLFLAGPRWLTWPTSLFLFLSPPPPPPLLIFLLLFLFLLFSLSLSFAFSPPGGCTTFLFFLLLFLDLFNRPSLLIFVWRNQWRNPSTSSIVFLPFFAIFCHFFAIFRQKLEPHPRKNENVAKRWRHRRSIFTFHFFFHFTQPAESLHFCVVKSMKKSIQFLELLHFFCIFGQKMDPHPRKNEKVAKRWRHRRSIFFVSIFYCRLSRSRRTRVFLYCYHHYFFPFFQRFLDCGHRFLTQRRTANKKNDHDEHKKKLITVVVVVVRKPKKAKRKTKNKHERKECGISSVPYFQEKAKEKGQCRVGQWDVIARVRREGRAWSALIGRCPWNDPISSHTDNERKKKNDDKKRLIRFNLLRFCFVSFFFGSRSRSLSRRSSPPWRTKKNKQNKNETQTWWTHTTKKNKRTLANTDDQLGFAQPPDPDLARLFFFLHNPTDPFWKRKQKKKKERKRKPLFKKKIKEKKKKHPAANFIHSLRFRRQLRFQRDFAILSATLLCSV